MAKTAAIAEIETRFTIKPIMQRAAFNIVRALAGIAGVVYLLEPAHTATQQLLGKTAVDVVDRLDAMDRADAVDKVDVVNKTKRKMHCLAFKSAAIGA